MQTALSLGGKKEQAYVAQGALERRAVWILSLVCAGLVAVLLFGVACFAYVASLPHEKPVIIVQNADGSYMPYSEHASPTVLGEKTMLAHWIGCFRQASSDPKSLCAQETAALLDAHDSTDVISQVTAYNAAVAKEGVTVTPKVYGVYTASSSPYEFELRWDETRSDAAGKSTVASMMANVTVAYDDTMASLHTDILTNPFGMYVKSMHVIDLGVKK